MAQPYAAVGSAQYASHTYNYYSQPPQQPYGYYDPAGIYHPGYDPHYAAWYHQQQQQPGTGSHLQPGSTQVPAAPNAEVSPPLPPEDGEASKVPAVTKEEALAVTGESGEVATASTATAASTQAPSAAAPAYDYSSYYAGSYNPSGYPYTTHPGYAGGYDQYHSWQAYAQGYRPADSVYAQAAQHSASHPWTSQSQGWPTPPTSQPLAPVAAEPKPAAASGAPKASNTFTIKANPKVRNVVTADSTPAYVSVKGSQADVFRSAMEKGAKENALQAAVKAANAAASKLGLSDPAAKAPAPAPAPAPKTTGNAQPAAAGSTHPPALQAYVTRAISLCKTDEHRNTMKQYLMELVKKVKNEGTLWVYDWDREPIPRPWEKTKKPAPDTESDDVRRTPPSPYQPLPYSGKRSRHDKWGAAEDDTHSVAASSKSPAAKAKKGSDKNKWAPTPAERAKRVKRANRFGDSDAASAAAQEWAESPRDGAGRYQGFNDRFAYQNHRKQMIHDAAQEDAEVDWDTFVVKGACQKLEKSYFRLTSAPNAAEVRPEPVLKQALDRLVRMIQQREQNYFYYNDQFKAMRQDLTVQRIRNELTVQVSPCTLLLACLVM